jgi:hypothetical protein
MPDKYKMDTDTIRPNIGNSMRAEDLRKGIAALEQGFMNAPSGIDPEAYEKAVVSSIGAFLGQRGITPPAEAMGGREAMSKYMYGQMDEMTSLPDPMSSKDVTDDTEMLYGLQSVSRAED